MRKSRFSDRQIVVVLKQAEAGVPIQDLVRKYGISEQTFYRWRKKYGGLQASELQQLKQLKEENRRLKGHSCATSKPVSSLHAQDHRRATGMAAMGEKRSKSCQCLGCRRRGRTLCR